MYLISLTFPLIGSLACGLFGRSLGKTGSMIFSTGMMFCCIVVSMTMLYEVILLQSPVHLTLWPWMVTDTLSMNLAFYFDPMTMIMMMVVSIISSLVHLYSCWYMAEDPHVPRFISYLSAFTFSMLILVTGDNYGVLFLGWEAIGVFSFLLINFWITRVQASKAAIQAMTVNRVGDMFLTISFFICIYVFQSLDYSVIFSLSPYINTTTLNIIGILFLIACAGKSAQIGLHHWLVNAMEGPTPVSSMLHAATLVTAGIYLLMRSSHILELAPLSLMVILIVGSITCLFAATIGLMQNDIKRVIAFSTMSQIGYLVIGVGLSQYNTVLLHLSGHAFFKALLFLAAGGVIHSMSDIQDMRKMGGLINFLPFTYTAILIGSLSLMAIFPLSGFYSKDFILELAAGSYTPSSSLAYIFGTLTAGITAFYSMRLISLTFLHTANGNLKAYNGVHDQPMIVIIPLCILMLFSIFYGYLVRDIFTGMGTDGLMSSTFQMVQVNVDAEFQSLFYKLLPTVVTLISGGLATFAYNSEYGQDKLNQLFSYTKPGYKFLLGKWYYDVVINRLLVGGMRVGHSMSQIIDRGTLEVLGPRGINTSLYNYSNRLQYIDSGKISSYASYMIISTLTLLFLI